MTTNFEYIFATFLFTLFVNSCKNCPPCYNDYPLDACYNTFSPYKMNDEVSFINSNAEIINFQVTRRDTIQIFRTGHDSENHNAGDWDCCPDVFFETLEITLQGDSTNRINFVIEAPTTLTVEMLVLGNEKSRSFGLSKCEIHFGEEMDTLIIANKSFLNIHKSARLSDTLDAFYYSETGDGLVGFVMEGVEWALEK